ncbi:DUF3048 domain-containing protein [Ruminococcaceae bacterium OttesenSCG-928-D13]|nr:DUF3048 domain-containing protein [Ruminococcaceae bacterium OttesenSCG-928-D13]
MNRILAFSLALLMTMLAAGCADNSSSSVPPVESSSVSVPDSSTPEPAPQPEPAVFPSVLTGLPVPEDEVPGTRIAAVVVDNNSLTHTFQHGLSAAEVLVEMPVEQGITRFLAFYENYAEMPTVGPVRSSRDGFLQLAMPFQPLYVCAGGGMMHNWYADLFEQHHLIFDDATARQPELVSGTADPAPETTAFTDGALLAEQVAGHELDDARAYASSFFHFLPFGAPARTLPGESAEAMKISFSEDYQSYFDYDSATHRYMMSRSNSSTGADRVPATDAGSGEARLGFDNLLVLFAEMPVYDATDGLLNIQFGTGGAGFYFSGGGWQKLRWQKDSPQHTLCLVDAEDGVTPVELNPGTTYLAFADVEQAEHFSFGPHGGEITLREREA